MRLRHALILALASAALASVFVAFDLSRRLEMLEGVAPETVAPLREAGTPYLMVLVAVGVADLAALLLLIAAFREERTAALLQASQSAGRLPAVRGGKRPAGDAVESPGPAEPPKPPEPERQFPWGRIEPWSSSNARPLGELWNRACAGLYQACPKEWASFEKFFGAEEFDASGSVAAVDAHGRLLGAVLALRQPAFEDEGYWWLESPAVLAAVLVDPAARRKGIGRALVQHAEYKAIAGSRPRLFVGGLENFPHLAPGVPDQDHGARMFFTAMGYREIRRTCHMEADYRTYQPPQELIDREENLKERGYRFAPAVTEDLEAFEKFVEGSNLSRKARRIERFRAEIERFYLVRKDEAIVGFIQVTPIDEYGHSGIHLIYFLREHRGAGLGSVLLVKAHELWRRMGAKGGSIWTYPEAAERFYRRAGFKTVQEWVCYEKDFWHSWADPEFVNRWR
ncbi:MAG: GNAT family N-acetyltransferase [Planctomycetota bacterium]|nr:GNAT family N-acetyltransferase [Planctomycetota bacterium]